MQLNSLCYTLNAYGDTSKRDVRGK